MASHQCPRADRRLGSYAIASPEVFMLLTRDQGWTVTAYEEWLADQLIHALLNVAVRSR